MSKDDEFYQEKINLTPAQVKAWTQLVRAVGRCKKENIYFYQCLETLCGLNGHNVHEVGDSISLPGGMDLLSPSCLGNKCYPQVETSCSFADDDQMERLMAGSLFRLFLE